ncbi:MAG: 1-deoxy-D-xylulose-5-phosphate synthase [Chitinivibrionales bacterium]|nr:1-deoxy-D-xylulose-5-phosphate synthase [Chitinivibrionales bacterium]MBD3395238.1 1-deoxy-D-xylulose-5-phosphate synthase [Chitinivibrionales bacterium]
MGGINSPADLRALNKNDLPFLASELREYMIDVVSTTGGHLASSLGTVELTIALHYCFDTPTDKLIWDVGHQAYAHKILTGRRDAFPSLRQFSGISGFPRTAESEYDHLTTGHAATSISAGLGMAIARDLKKEKFAVVSIIGDGSLGSGLAFEGLNNLGAHQDTAMTVVLNDNEMSISKNVGALSRYLTRVITDTRYNRIKRDVWELMGRMPHVGKRLRTLVHDVDDALKHFLIPGKLFEDMGLRYFGPVDGHNLREMIEVFKFVREHGKGPALVHVITRKGKGYSFAENNATKYHGIGTFSIDTGDAPKASKKTPSYSEIMGTTLAEIGAKHKQVVAISAAMPDGTGLVHFRDAFPDRFFDVGIAEGHAVTFAAGLAAQGLKPVVAIYSTFLQRAYDQIVHDVALDGRNVVFCLDRAGLVGEDGPTHHGSFDISYVRHLPGVTIMAPADENELRDMLYTAVVSCDGPVFVRYPRGGGRGIELSQSLQSLEVPVPRTVVEGTEGVIVSLGDTYALAGQALALLGKRGMHFSHVDARFAKPLDSAFYGSLFDTYRYIVTMESNALAGGFGSSILELAARQNKSPRVLQFGYPDLFVPHGSVLRLHESLGLTPPAIADRIAAFAGARQAAGRANR